MESRFNYLNFREKSCSADIGALYPAWEEGRERLAVFSPHDDDALIGAGYAMAAALENGAELFVFIICNGDCGYSNPGERDTIVGIRQAETVEAYKALGVPAENIVRFDYPDFSTRQYMGYKMRDGSEGAFIRIVRLIRELRITRVMVPNGYREHFDHEVVHKMGAYDAVQAGDPVLADFGAPQKVKSMLEYSVWADFSPEDALLSGGGAIRANRAALASAEIERKVAAGLACFKSQGMIIDGLVRSRAERQASGGYLELYLAFDPRPKLNFQPYVDLADDITKR